MNCEGHGRWEVPRRLYWALVASAGLFLLAWIAIDLYIDIPHEWEARVIFPMLPGLLALICLKPAPREDS